MAEQAEQQQQPFTAAVLINRGQQVIAINAGWRQLDTQTPGVRPGSNLRDLSITLPGLAEWIMSVDEDVTEASREFQNGPVRVMARLMKLWGEAGERLLLLSSQPAAVEGIEEDPYLRLRHDLKNRIGGLKLYATFLKRKLSDQAELLDVVGKMINSLDQMTGEANKIRRMEGENK